MAENLEDSTISLKQKTVIAYYDPFDVYSEIKDILDSFLPLVNLHWNHPLRPLRSIPVLDVDFVEETAHDTTTPKHQMLGLSSEPYLKIAFVKCEDNETYRGTIRKILQEWMEKNVNGVRDPTEWLIVHYVPHGGKASSGNRFKYGVFDKIKIDFNGTSKQDRTIQIRQDYSSDSAFQESWKEFINKIKEGVLEAFSKRVDLYQEEILKLEAKKHVLGWNFAKFFVMKEGLALAFEKISLYEDALLLYDELEESFLQISRKKTVTFFTSVGFDTIPNPLLLIQKEETKMRHSILSNEVTLFDFHCYLFARQAYLLLCLAKAAPSPSIAAMKVGELFLRLRSFLGDMTGFLLTNRKVVQAVSEWIYDVAQEFLSATGWVDGKLVREVAEGRGELILLLRKSLETIASTKQWYIEGVLSEISLDPNENIADDYEIGNLIMAKYLDSAESFYDEYKKLTTQALVEFEISERERIQNRLTAQLALLEYQLHNYETATKLLENIPDLYSRQGWDLLSTSLLIVYIKCLKHFNRKQDIMVNSLELLSRPQYLNSDEILEHSQTIQKLAEDVSCSANFDRFFQATVDTNIGTSSTSDCYILMVNITNPLTHEFCIDSATITMRNVNDSSDVITFEVEKPEGSSEIVLKPGVTTLRFENQKLEQVTFKVTALFLSKGKLTFTKRYTDVNPVLINIFPSEENLHASFNLPNKVLLSERRVGLLIKAGKTKALNGKVTFKGLTNGLKLMSMKVNSEKGEGLSKTDVKVSEGRPPVISFSSLEPLETLMLTIPYVVDFNVNDIKLKAYIKYNSEEGREFQYVVEETVDISLAVSVNVQDFYKGDKLFSKFSISCNHVDQPVRVLNTNLSSTKMFDINSPSGTDRSCISYSNGPVSFVFCIKKKPNNDTVVASSEFPDTVPLSIKHRYIKDECLVILRRVVKETLADSKFSSYTLLVKKALKSIPINLLKYLQTGKVDLSPDAWPALKLANSLNCLSYQNKEELISYLKDNIDNVLKKQPRFEVEDNPSIFEDVTRDLLIPVLIPQVHIVHTVELVLPNEDHFVVGKSVEATISISSYQNWVPPQDKGVICDKSNGVKFSYDIPVSDNWAFSGKKRSFFSLGRLEGEKQDFKLTLIPLRTGKLLLPRIEVQAQDLPPVLKNPQAAPTEETNRALSMPFSMEINYRNDHQYAVVVPEFQDRLTLTF